MKNSLLALLMMHWASIFAKGVSGMEHERVDGGGPIEPWDVNNQIAQVHNLVLIGWTKFDKNLLV